MSRALGSVGVGGPTFGRLGPSGYSKRVNRAIGYGKVVGIKKKSFSEGVG